MPVQAAAADPLASINPVLGMWVGVAATILALGAALRYRGRLIKIEAENLRSGEVAGKLAELLNASPDQFLYWDLVAGSEETSPGLASFVGLPATEQVQFADICGLFSGVDRARLAAAVEALHAGGEEFELTLDTPAGDNPIARRTLCLRGAAIIDDDGAPATSVVWVRDETRQAVNNRPCKSNYPRQGICLIPCRRRFGGAERILIWNTSIALMSKRSAPTHPRPRRQCRNWPAAPVKDEAATWRVGRKPEKKTRANPFMW